jgi:5-(carboxyamino)imidazole ribonucleotide mutase
MANGHFLLFILRQREKSAISVRKKHKFQTENKTLHKMFGKTLDSGGRIRYNKVYPNGARCAVWEIGEGGRKRHDEVQGCCYDGFSFFPGTSSCRSAPFRGLNRRRSFVCLTAKEVSTFMKKVAVIMGSDSDLPVLKGAFEQLKKLGISFEAHVYSAHRTPAEAAAFAASARESGFGVLIAAAGKAAHLAGALAAQTTLPVIGIPVKSSTLDGLDALLSTVQMPSGMPVATVAIDGAANAALLAAQILAVEDETLAEKLLTMRRAQHDAVIAKDAALVVE